MILELNLSTILGYKLLKYKLNQT